MLYPMILGGVHQIGIQNYYKQILVNNISPNILSVFYNTEEYIRKTYKNSPTRPFNLRCSVVTVNKLISQNKQLLLQPNQFMNTEITDDQVNSFLHHYQQKYKQSYTALKNQQTCTKKDQDEYVNFVKQLEQEAQSQPSGDYLFNLGQQIQQIKKTHLLFQNQTKNFEALKENSQSLK